MDNAIIQTIPPHQCPNCGNKKFHKTEKKIQYFQALVGAEVIFVEVQRRRYRCSGCQSKIWDRVSGACSYKKKTDGLVQWERRHETGKETRKKERIR
ncbi:transposase family protein [Brevibacillus choshinensis]|uniref:Transposase family protein n=1 Tax=Brevibacillus choshinensis TaxID=54911 RepID=A0ABX7FM61_BRECH|nr:transposase family protein [Brevibacillus choshinensis]QRG66774.1 transposase family protein [Brevibacillus choshinensis]